MAYGVRFACAPVLCGCGYGMRGTDIAYGGGTTDLVHGSGTRSVRTAGAVQEYSARHGGAACTEPQRLLPTHHPLRLFTAHCSLLTAHCSLLTAHSLITYEESYAQGLNVSCPAINPYESSFITRHSSLVTHLSLTTPVLTMIPHPSPSSPPS
eukprot:885949-Rhodomonas_salina.1